MYSVRVYLFSLPLQVKKIKKTVEERLCAQYSPTARLTAVRLLTNLARDSSVYNGAVIVNKIMETV